MADDKGFDWGKLDVAGGAANQPPRETVIVHCANGHRLVVPAALAGKRGKCSKCQATFQIPAVGEAGVADVVPPTPQHVDGHAVPHAAPAAEPAEVGPDMFGGLAVAPAGVPAIGDLSGPQTSRAAEESEEAEMVAEAAREQPVPAVVSIAALVARLWEEVEHGGVIELQLVDGTRIMPTWFEPRWSGGTHGLFATEADNHRMILTAVAWDAVKMVVVRNVDGLPDGMFE